MSSSPAKSHIKNFLSQHGNNNNSNNPSVSDGIADTAEISTVKKKGNKPRTSMNLPDTENNINSNNTISDLPSVALENLESEKMNVSP